MDPAFLFGHLDLANRFAMEGLNMAFAAELHRDGKPLPKLLFIDIMVEKTQKLIEHIKHHHLGLSLTANIGENSASIKCMTIMLPLICNCYILQYLTCGT